MSRWFRFHADALRNPKVARLSDAQFRLWVELMAVAAENEGLIPALDDLKHVLKRRLDHLSRGVDDLIRAGLMDVLEDGYEPHNWSKHQYKSDVSTARVTKHREKRNVSETPPETDTEADTEEEKGETSVSHVGPVEKIDPPLPDQCKAIADLWNATAKPLSLSLCAKMTGKRRASCLARIRDDGMEAIISAIERVPKSSFLRGETGDWSGASIDFILRPDTVTKILEGKYDDRHQPRPTGQRFPDQRESARETAERLATEYAQPVTSIARPRLIG